MTEIKPNSNFYSLAGSCSPVVPNQEYKLYRSSWIDNPKNFVVRDFPLHIDIEVSSRCNLKCSFCDKLPVLPKDKLGDMDFGIYKKIVDEGASYSLWGIKLSYRGEPLLNKEICRMVNYAKEKGILDVYFNTNGMLLDESLSRELIKSGLDRISISIEGIDAIEFERQRIGAELEVIKKNIEVLLYLRRKMNTEYPKVRVQTVYLDGIDMDEYRSFWGPYCDEVAVVDYKDGAVRKEGIILDWACPQLWQRMTVEWDGTIHPCNNDDSGLFIVGNLKQDTVHKCWHDLRVKSARELHKQGRSHNVMACNGCPWRTAQIEKFKK